MKLGLIVFSAMAVACAADPLRPLVAKSAGPQWDGLDRPKTCADQTLRALDLPLGTVLVVRQTEVLAPGRAVVASEPYACGGLARSACVHRAEQYAQTRAWKLGLSARLTPTQDDSPSEVEIQYIEPYDRAHALPAAEVEYELPWGERAQRKALGTLRSKLADHALELDERSERDVELTLAKIGAEEPFDAEMEPEGDPEEAKKLALPRIEAAPQVLRLKVRCKADSGGRARATSQVAD